MTVIWYNWHKGKATIVGLNFIYDHKEEINMSLTLKRVISLLLCIIILLPTLVACGQQTENPSDTDNKQSGDSGDANNTEVSETETTDPVQDALDRLTADVDWGGKDFGMLYVNDIGGYVEEVEATADSGDSSSSGVINDAVFERNTLFEEYCKLNFVLIPVSSGMVSTSLKSEVQTGTGDFHLITQTMTGSADSAISGYLHNFMDLDIDYETPWWDAGTLDFALCGQVFFMDGPFNIVDDDVTFVMMFNKELQKQHQVPNPYETVMNGDWTLDNFNSIISNLSVENGDGKWDEKDTYGFSTPYSIGTTFFYGAGLQYVINDRTMDQPELALDSSKMEKALDVLAKARSIVKEGNSTYVAEGTEYGKAKEIFLDGRSLFYVEVASYLRALNKNMETEYGVIPIPKYNKEQEKYHTWRAGNGSTLSIPTTVASMDVEMFAKVLETYCVLSQKLVRPAYYDIMLTTRNVQDVESSEMLDLIFENRIYDMGAYFEVLGFNTLFNKSVIGEDTFSSSYAAAVKTYEKKMFVLLQKIEKD